MFLILFLAISSAQESHTDHIAGLYASWGADLHYAVKEQNETFVSFKCSAEFPNLFGDSGFKITEGPEKGDNLQVAVDIVQIAQYVLTTPNENFNLTKWDIVYMFKGDPDRIHDDSWSGRNINAVFQRAHIDHFFAECLKAVDCSENWPSMTGSNKVCTPDDPVCYYECDDPSYFCPSRPTDKEENFGVVVCDPRNGNWTLGSRFGEEACICQKMEYLCQTPGIEAEEYDQTENEKKFAEYGFELVSGCNKGRVYLSSSKLIDDVIKIPFLYSPTDGNRTCTMTCQDSYEIKGDCEFTTFTCTKTSRKDSRWNKTIWEWTPNDCVPKCSYKTHDYDYSDDSDKILGIVGIVFGSLVLFSGAAFLAFYCWRKKRLQTPDAYAPLNQ